LQSIRYNYKYNKSNQQQQAVAQDSTGTIERKEKYTSKYNTRLITGTLLRLSQCRNFINTNRNN